MIKVQTVDLAPRGVTLPSDRVRMVIAQPYVELTAAEPFRCDSAAKERQLAVLTETLNVSRDACHGAAKTHFTVFPEYSIPGLDGMALIDAALSDANWQPGTIVIGGSDGLSKADFSTLVATRNTHLDEEHNALGRIADHEWINCGITWVKAANGNVERWLQPKLSRASLQQDVPCRDMFLGKSVFSFKGLLDNGRQFRFCTLVCFDWIASIDGKKAWRWVMEDLQQQADQAQADLSLTWFFVIQRNPKPSHDTFLIEVGGFFDQTIAQGVSRNDTCLVFTNNAGCANPGRTSQFGSTSLIFSPQVRFAVPTCRPTFCSGGQHFRSSTLLDPYHDMLFRERGACIHSFAQVNPRSFNAAAAGRPFPIEEPSVFPLSHASDPRTPGAPVPACIKWLNDELDDLRGLDAHYRTCTLASQAATSHLQTVKALRALPDTLAGYSVTLAAKESKAKHADEWGRTEAEAVAHLVDTLDIIGIGFPSPKVGVESAHATAIMNGQAVDLLAIRGNSHEGCLDHAKKFCRLPRRQVLLVSRDRDNTAWPRAGVSFLQTKTPRLGEERRVTDPQAGMLHMGYEKLLRIFLNSPAPPILQRMIYDRLTA